MPLPLIYAAGAVVARFIAKKGLQAAAKKFTKKAISEGKKHADDLLKKNGGKTAEKAANIKKIKPTQALNANSRSTLRKGLGVGAVGGAAVTAAALKARLAKKDREIKEAQGAAAKAKLRADKEIINATLAKAMLEDKNSSAPKKSIKPKSRPKPMRPKARP